MNPALDQRLSRVIQRRQEEISSMATVEDHPDLQRRLALAKVKSELPRLVAQISGAVAEVNDRIAEANIWIKLDVGEHTPAAEAVYRLSVVGREQEGPVLALSVEYTGKLRGVLCGDQSRSLLESSTVFTIDRTCLTNMLVALLEAHYH